MAELETAWATRTQGWERKRLQVIRLVAQHNLNAEEAHANGVGTLHGYTMHPKELNPEGIWLLEAQRFFSSHTRRGPLPPRKRGRDVTWIYPAGERV